MKMMNLILPVLISVWCLSVTLSDRSHWAGLAHTTRLQFCLKMYLLRLVTSHAGVIAKYCDDHVYVCVSLCLSVREDIFRTTRAMSTKFLCMFPMAVARSSFGGRGDEIPRRRGNFGAFFLIDNALYNIAFGTQSKTA